MDINVNSFLAAFIVAAYALVRLWEADCARAAARLAAKGGAK
jgi:hypothetical protein